MKKFVLLLCIITPIIIPIQSGLFAQITLPDSLIFKSVLADVGETWRTATAIGFSHYNNNSYFKEPNGTHHLAYIDNYDLYYIKSTDDGASWTKEQVITGHEGDHYVCAITVDTSGKVFIGFTIHSLFNYANPPGFTGDEWTKYFLYDAYCVNNKTGSWVTELVQLHNAGNFGPKVNGMFIDSANNVHLTANYYGWNSYGGTAWEWIRNSNTDTWGTTRTICTFTDTPVDRFIYDTYTIVPDQMSNVTIVMCRNISSTNTALPRLFYVRYNGTSWQSPVTITDSIAVAWNRFDAVVDPAGHTYIAYEQNNAQGLPVLKVIKDFQPPQTAIINLAQTDTLYYFRLHCNDEGLFTMYLTIKNQNPRITFSKDMINWSEPVTAPDGIKNFLGGAIVRTDTRRGLFTDYCEQMIAIAGPRTSQPYGPDTVFYANIRILDVVSAPILIDPPDASVVDTHSVVFTWYPAEPEATNYWIEIDTTIGFASSFIDSSLTATNFSYDDLIAYKTYYWRVKAKNQRGWGEFSDAYTFNAVFLSVGGEDGLPSVYALSQNFPNPFNPVTTIHIELPKASNVVLKVYDLIGQEMMTILNEKREAGRYDIQVDAAGLSSGIYFYRLQANDFIQTKKFIMVK
jgi:hypothetical protein